MSSNAVRSYRYPEQGNSERELQEQALLPLVESGQGRSMRLTSAHLRWTASIAAALVFTPIIGQWFIELADELGLYERPAERARAMIAALTASAWFHWIGGGILGFFAGVWLDALVRREPKSRAADRERVAQRAEALARNIGALFGEHEAERSIAWEEDSKKLMRAALTEGGFPGRKASTKANARAVERFGERFASDVVSLVHEAQKLVPISKSDVWQITSGLNSASGIAEAMIGLSKIAVELRNPNPVLASKEDVDSAEERAQRFATMASEHEERAEQLEAALREALSRLGEEPSHPLLSDTGSETPR